MYKSMKEKLDGASLDDIYVVLVDYLYNSLVYPEIAMDMDIANISGAFGKMKGVVVSLKSGQTNKMIEIEAARVNLFLLRSFDAGMTENMPSMRAMPWMMPISPALKPR